MIAWMAYAALVGVIVAVGGLALERLAAATGRPRRIAWLAALALAVAIPLTGGWGTTAEPPVDIVVPERGVVDGAVVVHLWSAIPALPVPRGRANGRIALLAWAAGSLAVLAALSGVLILVARGRRRWRPRRVRGAEVYVSRRFGPALVGIVRPKVVIPAWVMELGPGARDAIIRHETEHARARDHLVLLCGGLVAAAFPWSPAIWWMYRRLRAAVELDCDQRVLASGIGVAEYGDILLGAGCRSRGRWSFSPAMGQPESLLERRLKTMSETGRKLSGGYAVLLAAVAAGAVVVACDTPVPTEVREAFAEVTAEEEARGTDADQEDWVVRFLGAGAFGSQPAPLLYVDGVRIRSETDLFSMDLLVADVETGKVRKFAESIERVEVLKGPEAAKLYGEEAAGGVIQIFMGAAEPVPEVVVLGNAQALVAGQVSSIESEAEATVAPSGRAIVVTRQVSAEKLVVTGQVSAEKRFVVEDIVVPSVEELVVTGQTSVTSTVSNWNKWHTFARVFANAPPDSKPIVHVDGVRVDGDAAGLHDLLGSLNPGDIDRMVFMHGENAEKKYGKEAANGVILVFTK
ncbi:MAG: TonB-dependent receptor plug domain-containing protein [Gemmatimonadota bacterium]|nr:TonB-dependent receptor plug domain-containing protein [Gemmatimonadota bacterium]